MREAVSAWSWWKDADGQRKVWEEGWEEGDDPMPTRGNCLGITYGARRCRSHIRNSLQNG